MEEGPTVRLWSGRVVCNTCPRWRMECEARELLLLPDEAIKKELQDRRNLGRKDVDQLRELMLSMRKA